MKNEARYRKHFETFMEAKQRQWQDAPMDARARAQRAANLEKWSNLFHTVFLKDERFLHIAEPFTDSTPMDPCQYYMRFDGCIVFVENALQDDRGELIGGHPLRFPYVDECAGPYLSHNIEPDIFGIPMKCTTRVIWNGRKDYAKQTEECQRIIQYQKNSRYPFLPLYFDWHRVDGTQRQIMQTPVFRRDNFVFHFPFANAMDYMYKVLKFEPIVKGANWLMHEAHKYPYADFPPIKYSNLGVTGSSSFGDTNDKEDFDVVFINDMAHLKKYRDFIYTGIKEGMLAPVTWNRRLRAYVKHIPIECNNNLPLLLCSFMNMKDPREDYLYRAKFRILDKIDYFEALVEDDTWNLINPPRVTLVHFQNVRAKRFLGIKDGMLFVAMTGTARGLYSIGMRLSVKNSLLVEFTPEHGKPFRSIVSPGWYDVDVS